ncbi:hypothetical protein T484DRAFT_3072404 [Baffinella frigidus]|nr:hypothetical protein T484DRAFT_3072404 [Cryptophyta sp. CCMP2293]
MAAARGSVAPLGRAGRASMRGEAPRPRPRPGTGSPGFLRPPSMQTAWMLRGSTSTSGIRRGILGSRGACPPKKGASSGTPSGETSRTATGDPQACAGSTRRDKAGRLPLPGGRRPSLWRCGARPLRLPWRPPRAGPRMRRRWGQPRGRRSAGRSEGARCPARAIAATGCRGALHLRGRSTLWFAPPPHARLLEGGRLFPSVLFSFWNLPALGGFWGPGADRIPSTLTPPSGFEISQA